MHSAECTFIPLLDYITLFSTILKKVFIVFYYKLFKMKSVIF